MKNNGSKTFLFVVVEERGDSDASVLGLSPDTNIFVVKSDHDPEPEELIRALDLECEPHELTAIRFDEAAITTLPPKAKAL